MNRKQFFLNTLATGASMMVPPLIMGAETPRRNKAHADNTNSLETIILTQLDVKPLKILQISDSHISCDEEIDIPYQKYSKRMGDAYKQTRHFLTGELTNPVILFKELMNFAKKEKPDLIALTGDLINYPSVTAVNFVKKEVESTGIPYFYTAGNHDWHYEGMAGTADELRREWTEKRLKPLYNEHNAMYGSITVNGVNLVWLDNSTYQISEEQLAFYQEQKHKKLPMMVFVHIPIYMPSMAVVSCGHPQWKADADPGFEIERRPKWSTNGNNPATVSFVNEIMTTTDLLGIFAGHWHNHHTIIYKGIHQHIAFPAFSGQYRLIHLNLFS